MAKWRHLGFALLVLTGLAGDAAGQAGGVDQAEIDAREQKAAAVRGGLTIPLDYLQFWSTGYLAVHGENPYDATKLHDLQKRVYPELSWPIISWHPPFALLLSLPFGMLPVSVGYLLWIALQMGCILLASVLFWKSEGGQDRDRLIAVGLAIGFGPTLIVIMMAQVTPVCLLGLAGFAMAARAQRPVLGGVALALTAWKPHLLGIFGVILLLEATRSRFTRVAVFTGAGVLLTASLVVTAVNPRVPGWYRDVLTGRADPPMPYKPADVPSPTLGSFLREFVATGGSISDVARQPEEIPLPTRRKVVPGSAVVQLIPFAVLAVISIGFWYRQRESWDWSTAIPWLVLASMAASPYGSWTFDLVMLLAVAIPTAARLRSGWGGPTARTIAVAWYFLISGTMFAATLVFYWNFVETDFVVIVPLAAVGLCLVQRAANRAENHTMPAKSPEETL